MAAVEVLELGLRPISFEPDDGGNSGLSPSMIESIDDDDDDDDEAAPALTPVDTVDDEEKVVEEDIRERKKEENKISTVCTWIDGDEPTPRSEAQTAQACDTDFSSRAADWRAHSPRTRASTLKIALYQHTAAPHHLLSTAFPHPPTRSTHTTHTFLCALHAAARVYSSSSIFGARKYRM